MSGSHLCISRNETVISKTELWWSVSHFLHSYNCERFIYFQSAYSAAGKYVDRSWEYINRSQTHECENWDWGRAMPRNGIHKCDFPCSAYTHIPKFKQTPLQQYLLIKLEVSLNQGGHILGAARYLWRTSSSGHGQRFFASLLRDCVRIIHLLMHLFTTDCTSGNAFPLHWLLYK